MYSLCFAQMNYISRHMIPGVHGIMFSITMTDYIFWRWLILKIARVRRMISENIFPIFAPRVVPRVIIEEGNYIETFNWVYSLQQLKYLVMFHYP